MRERLPDRRRHLTHTVNVDGHTLHFTVGFYDDGRVGELWLDMHKFGSALRDWAHHTAVAFSTLLQYGAPLVDVCALYTGTRSDPHGRVLRSANVVECTSIMDAVARELLCEYADCARNLSTLEACAKRTTSTTGQGDANSVSGPAESWDLSAMGSL